MPALASRRLFWPDHRPLFYFQITWWLNYHFSKACSRSPALSSMSAVFLCSCQKSLLDKSIYLGPSHFFPLGKLPRRILILLHKTPVMMTPTSELVPVLRGTRPPPNLSQPLQALLVRRSFPECKREMWQAKISFVLTCVRAIVNNCPNF